MKIKHYKERESISKENKIQLKMLIQDSPFIVGNKLGSVIDAENSRLVFCVFDNHDDICGFLSIVEDETSIELSDLFIEHGQRRKGYAQALLTSALKYAKKENKRVAKITVAIDNVEGVNLYRKMGFIISKSTNKYFMMRQYVSPEVRRIGEWLCNVSENYGDYKMVEEINVCDLDKTIANITSDLKLSKSELDEIKTSVLSTCKMIENYYIAAVLSFDWTNHDKALQYFDCFNILRCEKKHLDKVQSKETEFSK